MRVDENVIAFRSDLENQAIISPRRTPVGSPTESAGQCFHKNLHYINVAILRTSYFSAFHKHFGRNGVLSEKTSQLASFDRGRTLGTMEYHS